MISVTIDAILQIIFFTLFPFLVYIIKNKSVKGFLNYIGLIKPTKKSVFLAVLLSLLFAMPMLLLTWISEDLKKIMFNPDSITGNFRQMEFGIKAVYILIVIALFKTSFAEEILFRGFIAKRLINVFGFKKGNFLQAIVFGFIHAALFALIINNYVFLIIIFIIPSIAAYFAVYLNEKFANGSIIPGWISHGLANLLVYSIVGFIM